MRQLFPLENVETIVLFSKKFLIFLPLLGCFHPFDCQDSHDVVMGMAYLQEQGVYEAS